MSSAHPLARSASSPLIWMHKRKRQTRPFPPCSRPNSLGCQRLRGTIPAHNPHPVHRSSMRPCLQHIITITTSNTTPVNDNRPMAPHPQLHHHIHGDLALDQPRQSQRQEWEERAPVSQQWTTRARARIPVQQRVSHRNRIRRMRRCRPCRGQDQHRQDPHHQRAYQHQAQHQRQRLKDGCHGWT